jgi:hypothetical protein
VATGNRGATVDPSRPVPPPVGLLPSALSPPDGEDQRWVNGFAFQALDCIPGGRFDPCDEDLDLQIPGNPENVDYVPFAVWTGFKCSPWDPVLDWARAVTEALLAVEEEQISAEFWRGDIARDASHPNRYLTDPDSDNLSSSALSANDALACLEQYLASCNGGQQGMIHASRQLVTLWQIGGALRREGRRIYTVNDTVVVPGAGYDGSGPADGASPEPAAGSQWAYATGLVTVRRESLQDVAIPVPGIAGETATITVPQVIGGPNWEGVDRSTNTIEARAQRLAAATWSGCCHAAVEVDVAACGIGGS